MKRFIVLMNVIIVLIVAGCGGGVGHAVGGIGAHHVANKLAPKHQRTINKAFCLYHGHRFLVDIRHHHLLGAGLNGWQAYKSCKAGFGHH